MAKYLSELRQELDEATQWKHGHELHPEDQKHVLAAYVHRFTGTHKPNWANTPRPDGTKYMPHHKDDHEWLHTTKFAVKKNGRLHHGVKNCQSTPTFPYGSHEHGVKEEVVLVDEAKKPSRQHDPAAWHEHRIAVDTVKNPMKGVFLGGPSAEEAEHKLRTKFGYQDHEIKKLKEEVVSDDELDSLIIEGGPTRKHFRQVASIIAAHPDQAKRKELAAHHGSIFAAQNPRFNHQIWNKACGADGCKNEEVDLDGLDEDRRAPRETKAEYRDCVNLQRSKAVKNTLAKKLKEDTDLDLDAIYDGEILTEEHEEHDAHELVLHADNDSHLYHSSHIPVVKNLEKKWRKGVYDSEKAKKLWKYHADRAAQSYHKEHGDPHSKWHHAFSPATRKAAAEHWEKHHRAEMEAGNFHDH